MNVEHCLVEPEQVQVAHAVSMCRDGCTTLKAFM